MWTREGIKDYAKDFLRKHYWKAFLVCLIATILSGGGSNNSSSNNSNNNYINEPIRYEQNIVDKVDSGGVFGNGSSPISFATRGIRSPLYYLSGGVFSIMLIFLIVLLLTVGLVIEVGKVRFFLHAFRGDVRIKNLFSGFNMKEYFPIIKTQLLTALYTFLWFLLLIIPGIIKSYEYRFVPYILAERPDLPSNEVITMSREITDGHKMDMFVLDLSFIGWYLLGALFFGLGGLFVDPYKEATVARLYNILTGRDDFYDEGGYDDYNIAVE